jgi:hypothetical protein
MRLMQCRRVRNHNSEPAPRVFYLGLTWLYKEAFRAGIAGQSTMKHKPHYRAKGRRAKRALRLPGLEHAKAAVLNSLTNADAQSGYRHAIDEFVD